MAFTDQELVEIGSRFTTQRLIEQGAVSVAMARAHEKELVYLSRADETARNSVFRALIAPKWLGGESGPMDNLRAMRRRIRYASDMDRDWYQ